MREGRNDREVRNRSDRGEIGAREREEKVVKDRRERKAMGVCEREVREEREMMQEERER